MQPSGKCPFCNRDAFRFPISGFDGVLVECQRCGIFKLTRQLEFNLAAGSTEAEQALVPYLAAYIRRMNAQDVKPTLGTTNWEALAQAHANTPLSQKVDRFLAILGERSRPGKAVLFDLDCDAPLFDARDQTEANYILRYLREQNLVADSGPLRMGEEPTYMLTVPGWARLEPGLQGLPGRCFVAMSFNVSLTDAYTEGIFAALKTDCGLDPFRIDREEHNDRIDDRIVVEIRRAQFTVADVTLQRQGVYFEAGFAMGLGRPVIWTCRDDDMKNVHFDTRQYSHVLWSSPADLRAKLATRVRATILGVRP
jgi:hypothetical protein